MNLDAILLQYLAEDILRERATDRLPEPPKVPVFTRPTVRPAKWGVS